ncbi:surface lipoprotein assembly modifier [Ursidibacter sp. B-7004-1]
MKSSKFSFIFLLTSPILSANPLADPVNFERLSQAVGFEQPFAKKSADLTASPKVALPLVNPHNLEAQINQAIIEQQWQNLPILLQHYQQQSHYDTTLVHYALGAFYYSQQRYPEAIQHYQAVLNQDPTLAYPRFDLGVMLYENQQYKQAIEQLTMAKADLAPAMQDLAERYLAKMEKEQGWQPDFIVQYVRTDNVNNASSSSIVNINGRQLVKDKDSLPQSAEGFRYGIGISKSHNLKSNHYLNTSLHYNGVYYWNNQDYSEQSLRFSLGYQYRNAQMSLGITPFVEQNWLGNPRYSKQFGATLHSYRYLTSKWRVSARLTHLQKRYNDYLTASRYDGFQNSASLTLRWQAVRSWQFFASIDVNRDQTKEKASSSHKFGGELGVIYRWKSWGTEFRSSYAKRHFEGEHYLYGYKRADKEYRANWSLWNEKWAWKDLMPKLNFSYIKIHSNMPDFYSRKNGEWFLTVEKRF